MLSVEEITDLKSLRNISVQWEVLLNKTATPDLFRTPEWCRVWWESLHPQNKKLYILVVKDEDNLIGIAPFMEVRDSFLGLPVKKIEFISMWKYAGSAASCLGSMDFIIAERYDEVMKAIITHLRTKQKVWDFIRLHPIPVNSPSYASLKQLALSGGYLFYEQQVLAANAVYFSSGSKDFISQLSPKFRKTLKESERKLLRQGEAQYLECTDVHNVDQAFSEILDIEKQSWKWNKGITINSTAFRDFYINLARAGAKNGWLSLWFLELNGNKIAYGLFFNYLGRVEYLKTGYDERFHLCSPGSLLMLKAFEKFFTTGSTSINLLAGGIAQKHRWQTKSENLSEVCIFKQEWYSKFLYLVLYKFSFYEKIINFETVIKRLLRKLNIHWKASELARMDQVSSGPWT